MIGRFRIRSRHLSRAFTLIELILVIIIILILAAISIPAYGSLTYSSNQSGSLNAVQASLQSARDAAVRAGSGRDAAAVFLLGQDGRVRIVVAEVAGTIQDENNNGDSVERDIFVPVRDVDVSTLPRQWSVRGYARSASLRTASLGTASPAQVDNVGWYEDTYQGRDRGLGQWVFPETAYYDDSAGDNGRSRQSFMVRFEGGTGRFLSSATRKGLFVDPAPVLSFRESRAPWADFRVDREEDLGRFVRRVLAPDSGVGLGAAGTKLRRDRRLLGDESTDTVLVGPVGQLAVYNERRLAEAIGADGLNRLTDTLYQPISGTLTAPEYDDQLFGGGVRASDINLRISFWLRASGEESEDQLAVAASDTSDARIFLVSRYLGQPIEARKLTEED